ncbi:FliG middle domain, partial [Friedmanniomyces endolithicus]
MSRMSGIKVDAVKSALQSFFDDYRQQSGLHGASRSYLKRSLDLALGSDIANSVLNTIYGDAIRPMMARLQYASPRWLAEFVSSEHVQMQAVFLAFLPPALPWTVAPMFFFTFGSSLIAPGATLLALDLFPHIRGT